MNWCQGSLGKHRHDRAQDNSAQSQQEHQGIGRLPGPAQIRVHQEDLCVAEDHGGAENPEYFDDIGETLRTVACGRQQEPYHDRRKSGEEKPFGELCVELGYLNQRQIKNALDFQQAVNKKIGEILIELDFVDKETIDKEFMLWKKEFELFTETRKE